MYQVLCLGTFDCSVNIFVMIGLFFLSAILSKQLTELADIEFSMIGATAIGVIMFFVIMTIFGNLRFGVLSGLIGIVIGGFVGAQFLGSGGGGDAFG